MSPLKQTQHFQMFEFLNDFARAIESAGDKLRKSSTVKPSDSAINSGSGKVLNVQVKKNYGECGVCKGNHRLIQCEKFNQLSILQFDPVAQPLYLRLTVLPPSRHTPHRAWAID